MVGQQARLFLSKRRQAIPSTLPFNHWNWLNERKNCGMNEEISWGAAPSLVEWVGYEPEAPLPRATSIPLFNKELHFICLAFGLLMKKREEKLMNKINQRRVKNELWLEPKYITHYSVIKESLLSLWRRQQTTNQSSLHLIDLSFVSSTQLSFKSIPAA